MIRKSQQKKIQKKKLIDKQYAVKPEVFGLRAKENRKYEKKTQATNGNTEISFCTMLIKTAHNRKMSIASVNMRAKCRDTTGNTAPTEIYAPPRSS